MSELFAERTNPPSPNRKQQFRKQGTVPRSLAVVTAAMLLGATVGLLWFGDELANTIAEGMRLQLQREPENHLSQSEAVSITRNAAWWYLLAAGPMLLTVCLLATSGNLLQGRCFWLPQKLVPDLGRCNPFRNWHQLCSWGQARDGLWSGCGMILILFVGVTSLWGRRIEILELAQASPSEWPWAFWRAALETVFHVALAAIFFSVADYALQWRKWTAMMRQTNAEKREEQRDREGDPALRGQRRRLHASFGKSEALRGSDLL